MPLKGLGHYRENSSRLLNLDSWRFVGPSKNWPLRISQGDWPLVGGYLLLPILLFACVFIVLRRLVGHVRSTCF